MELLFSTYDCHSVLEGQKQRMLSGIDALAESKILNTKLEEWVDYFVNEYSVNIVEIDESKITQEVNDVQIDPRYLGDRENFHYDSHTRTRISATEIAFYLPFTGDKNLLYVRPTTYNHNPPRVEISTSDELVFRYTYAEADAVKAKTALDRALRSINEFLSWQKSDIERFNLSLVALATTRLESKFGKIKKDNDVAASLGFPMRNRVNAQNTYIVPSVRKKINKVPTSSGGKQEKIEPTLSLEDYEHILNVMRNMVTVMEQSPHAFKGMDEETLRTHFLVQLNGQYEGQATGETFNFEGKTDILIKENGRNIFIAECKFWKGKEVFLDTIDQLLGYLSWRDTKASIIIFNRNKNLSSVLAQIPEIVSGHPSFLKNWKSSDHETEFKYILKHKDDPNRELFLTVQVYEIPV